MRPRGVAEPFKVKARRAAIITNVDGLRVRVAVECPPEGNLAAYKLLQKIARQQGWDASQVTSCDVVEAKGVRQR